MVASTFSSCASLVFPSSARGSLTSASADSYVGSEDVDASTCSIIDQMINCIRGGDCAAVAWQWHMVQHEIDAMGQEIQSKAKTQHTLAWSYALHLLAFADEITKPQLSPDKLFVVLRLHKVLNSVFVISQRNPGEFSIAKYNHVMQKLREVVFQMLHELKVLIQKRASRHVPEGGGIHEVTRYVMNYIRLLLHHRSTIGFILAHNDGKDESMNSLDHVVQDLIICLESMLNRAAEAYDSVGLQCFFLMNNLHFIVKQVDRLEMTQLLGHSWVQVHKDFIDQYTETYVHLSWGPVVSCLSTRKTMFGFCLSQTPSTVRFYFQFESIYYNQEQWKVEDPQLREEVRRDICNKVISAYRAHFEKSRNVQRQHEWYTPQLLEEQLMQLFEGRSD